ncbi:MAG: acyl-CoA thioesterase [Mariniphaga sp.]|nr:acyl-CoA thioesterase [Mariniphaga sp.]
MQKAETSYQYELDFTVRDYECDLQGIVNNAVYLNYFEHARHTFLIGQNIDFAALHAERIDLVVLRIEIDYKLSLTSGDSFIVRLNIQREGQLKLIFNQDIFKMPENKLVARAKVIGVGVKCGRPIRLEDVPGFNELV